jgi:hypothetical protein
VSVPGDHHEAIGTVALVHRGTQQRISGVLLGTVCRLTTPTPDGVEPDEEGGA